ncbi:MAG: HAD family phosphatase, partial [Anaerolineales bacterium]
VQVDTGEFHFQAWKTTLQDYDVPFSRETFKRTFGMNNEGILKLLLGERFTIDLYIRISDQKEKNFRRAIRGKVQLLPGVKALMVALKDDSVPQAIASSAPQENIDAIIRELKIQPYFKAVISAAKMPGKPDPSVFIVAAQELGVPPKGCVVIEDAISGVEAARRAGMKCVAVTTTNAATDLKDAHLVVESLSNVSVDDLKVLLD